MLARAADLWETGADPSDVEGHARLLELASLACGWVGRQADCLRLNSAARELVSSDRHPLWASRLILRSIGLHLGETEDRALADIERAVELSRVDPDSPEHADALTAYANALMWSGRMVKARQVVEEALAAARRSGSPAAISRAHVTRGDIVWDTDLQLAQMDATSALEHALASGERVAIGNAYRGRFNVEIANGDLRLVRGHAREAYDSSVRQGLTGLRQGIMLAQVLLPMGDLVEAGAVIRKGLAATGFAKSEAMIRLQAGVLAIRQGAGDNSRGHRVRAQELVPHIEEDPVDEPCIPFAQILLAQDGPAEAFEYVERILPVNAVDPRVVDELVVLGARAAADLVQQASDDRDQDAVQAHREALTRLVKTRAALPGIAFEPSGPDDTVQPARAALFAAECGRADGVEDQVGLWREAVAACAKAGLGWEEQTGSWRLAAALIEWGAPATEAAEILRGVHDYAVQQGAAPLQAGVEELADSARISLTSPRVPASATVPVAFTGLTARETEVLAYLVANRTNAEISEALFISEKTVSVHVSNLLRKTGTGSRREVAALARRVGWGTGEQDEHSVHP
jgi:DNA-binding CsgD family transcriptional regulator